MVGMPENTDQKNSKYEHFSRCVFQRNVFLKGNHIYPFRQLYIHSDSYQQQFCLVLPDCCLRLKYHHAICTDQCLKSKIDHEQMPTKVRYSPLRGNNRNLDYLERRLPICPKVLIYELNQVLFTRIFQVNFAYVLNKMKNDFFYI